MIDIRTGKLGYTYFGGEIVIIKQSLDNTRIHMLAMAKSITECISFYCDKVRQEVKIIINYGFREDDKIEYNSINCDRKSNCGVYPNTQRKFLKYSWYVCPACKVLETDIIQDIHDL